MVQAGSKYTLRAHRKSTGEILSIDELKHPSSSATIAAGLRPGILTLPAEKKRYSGNRTEYLEARNFILSQWHQDRTTFLTEQACIKAAPDSRRRMVKEVYRFLLQQGCINFGILKKDPLVPLPEDFFVVDANGVSNAPDDDKKNKHAVDQHEDKKEETFPELTDESLEDSLYGILKDTDLQTTSEKMIRAQLAAHFGSESEIKARKAQIRDLVTTYLNHKGPPPTYKDKATREAEQTNNASKRQKQGPRPLGRVIVIGAGPAGLTAALHLKRNNADVVVLEARDRVGGRVHSHQAAEFSAPIDLGASIITGTEPDDRRGLRADPSAVVCMQLGVKLHKLGDHLPLYDTSTSAVADSALDKQVEKIRDEIMDDAAAILENMPEQESAQQSFGDLIDRAVKEWNNRLMMKIRNAEEELEEEVGTTIDTAPPAVPVAMVEDDEAALVAHPTADHPGTTTVDSIPSNEEEAVQEQGDGTAMPPTALPVDGDAVPEMDGGPDVEDAGPARATADLATSTKGVVKAIPPSRESLPADTDADARTTAAPEHHPTHSKKNTENLKTTAQSLRDTLIALKALPTALEPSHLHLLDWHWANLEYGCSAPLSSLSGEHWNQDEEYGGFGGPHCMVIGGYDQIFKKIASLLDVKLSSPVTNVRLHGGIEKVEVITARNADMEDQNGNAESGNVPMPDSEHQSYWADAVVVAVPLGVLKAESIVFDPPLPQWKQDSISRLGFGDLNKIVLQFSEVFWDDSVDFFGAASGSNSSDRGWCFMFWNFHRFSQVPILAALISGEAAHQAESLTAEQLKDKAMETLRSLFDKKDDESTVVTEPVAYTVSRWASDSCAKGSYSYVALGSSGEDYDQLSKPVARRILFAGEHTIKEHPDTVGGAMMTGTREAARALEILMDDAAEGAATAAEVGTAVAELKRKRDQEGQEGRASKGGKSKDSGKKLGNKKQRSGRGGDDEDDEDEDDLERKFDRAIMGRSAARMQEEMREREASRAIAKEVWIGLMDAELGKTDGVVDVLSSAAAEDGRAKVTAAGCLARASPKAASVLAKDVSVMELFKAWIEDSFEEGRSSTVAIVDAVLRAVLALVVDADAAKKSGLDETIQNRCALHGDVEVRKLAAAILKRWTERDGKEEEEEGGDIGIDGRSAGGKTATGRSSRGGSRPMSAASYSDSLRKRSEDEGAAGVDPPVPMKIELDAETQRALREAEEAARELEQRAKELRSKATQGGIGVLGGGNGENGDKKGNAAREIHSFEEFQRREAAMKKKPKAKIERLREKIVDEESGPFDMKKKLDAIITSRLQPAYQSKQITKEQYKAILNKASEKVMSRVKPEQIADGKNYLKGYKNHIYMLVDEYIRKAKHSGK